MSGRTKTIWSMAINVTGVVVNMLTALLVMPFLIRELGAATYGLWSLIGSLTGYFGVLDFGVRPALGRLIAAHRARGEYAQINLVMSTATAVLLVVCVVVLGATVIAADVFPRFFSVPSAQTEDVRRAVVLVGITIALTFPTSVFDGFLWGYERFDVINGVDIPAVVIRTMLLVLVAGSRAPLTSFAAVVLLVNLSTAVCKGFCCYRVERNLRLAPHLVEPRLLRSIYSYGFWMSFISWSKTLIPQIAPTFIGYRLGTATVTTFAVARQLVAYTDTFANAATQVMAPRAIAAHATRAEGTQRRLFVEGGKLSYGLALLFFGGLVFLGAPFIHQWQHGLQDAAYPAMLVLCVGQVLPMSQWLTYSVIIGINRHRLLALLAVSEAVIVLCLCAGLIGKSGLSGVCVAVAIGGLLTRGVAQWLLGCRLLNVTVWDYMRRVFIPVSLAAAVPIAMLCLGTKISPPSSMVAVLLFGMAYKVLFGVAVGGYLIGYAKLKELAVGLLLEPDRRGSG
jgi:O-antigen/teichoic acid export membrane protein